MQMGVGVGLIAQGFHGLSKAGHMGGNVLQVGHHFNRGYKLGA
jgi:hypothetical protein